MRPGILPGDLDGPGGVFVQERFQQLGDRFATLVALQEDHGFPGVLVDGADAVGLGRLGRGRDHHVLPLGAPHGPERREPPQGALVGVGAVVAGR
jgi:hypothetical protein